MCSSSVVLFAFNSRKMSFRNSVSEFDCPFTNQPIEKAYGPEVSLFLHCHLRGYDKTGEGINGHHGNYHAGNFHCHVKGRFPIARNISRSKIFA